MNVLARQSVDRMPLHEQVSCSLQQRILRGEYPVGAFLPNEYELSRLYEVSVGTIRRAVEHLVERRLVERMQGKGTVVTGDCWNDLVDRTERFLIGQQKVSSWHSRELGLETVAAEGEIAQKLGLKPGEFVHVSKRVRSSFEGARIYEEIYLPQARFPDVSKIEEGKRDLISLARQQGVLVGRIVEDASVVLGDDHISSLLGVDPDKPLMRTVRISHDRRDGPLEYRISYVFLNGGALRISL